MPNEPTRETTVGVMASLLACACVFAVLAAILAGGWWLLAIVPALLPIAAASVYGAVESFWMAVRDEQGNPIR